MRHVATEGCSRRRKIRRRMTAILIIALIVSYMLFMTPFFSAMLIRLAFGMTEQSPPQNYAQISQTVAVYNDVTYASKHGRNTLDIYLPKDATQPLPTILWMHGGGYVGGDKRESRYFAASLAANGYAVVSFNYELAPEANYPTPLI